MIDFTPPPPLDTHGGPSGHTDDHKVKVDFSVSLNAFGPAPNVVSAIHAASIDSYPDPTSTRTRQAAAKHWECTPDNIAFGAGASELIYAIARAFLRPNDRVLILTPTFGEYQRAAQTLGATVHTVLQDLRTCYADLGAMARMIGQIRPTLTFVCSPNNPTGTVIPREHLAFIADACALVHGMLVIDQSYDAFATLPAGTPVLREHPSVLHLRSITKDHALAGIRAGFVIGPPAAIHAIELSRPPWSASTVAQAAAEAALSSDGEAHLAKTIPVLRAERCRIASECDTLKLRTIPGETHTLLIQVPDAATAQRYLLDEHGVRVRDCTSFGLPHHIRIAARTPVENWVLLSALHRLAPTVGASERQSA